MYPWEHSPWKRQLHSEVGLISYFISSSLLENEPQLQQNTLNSKTLSKNNILVSISLYYSHPKWKQSPIYYQCSIELAAVFQLAVSNLYHSTTLRIYHSRLFILVTWKLFNIINWTCRVCFAVVSYSFASSLWNMVHKWSKNKLNSYWLIANTRSAKVVPPYREQQTMDTKATTGAIVLWTI